MKDCMGRVIEEGQPVVTTLDGHVYTLELGEVIGFTEKKVRIKIHDRPGHFHDPSIDEDIKVLKFPEQVCIVGVITYAPLKYG